jgi:hypothetical protein
MINRPIPGNPTMAWTIGQESALVSEPIPEQEEDRLHHWVNPLLVGGTTMPGPSVVGPNHQASPSLGIGEGTHAIVESDPPAVRGAEETGT